MKNSYLNNYLERLFCEANCFNFFLWSEQLFRQGNCFTFQSNQDSFFVRLLVWHIKFEKRKELKKNISEELMPIAWQTKKWWDFCMSEDEKKEIEPIFTESCF